LRQADWIDVLRDGRAVYTVVLNLGIGLHAIDVFVIATVMPAVVADIGGVAYYAWSTMLYMVASIVGLESASAPLPYSAAKAALVNYGKNLARQLGPFNVRVNCVAPGNVLFPGGSWERHLAERRDEVLRQIEADVPLRRFGRPEEIADLIVFLCSDRAAFITGSCMVADGGQTRSM